MWWLAWYHIVQCAADGRKRGEAPRAGSAPGEQEPADMVSQTGGPGADLRGPGASSHPPLFGSLGVLCMSVGWAACTPFFELGVLIALLKMLLSYKLLTE